MSLCDGSNTGLMVFLDSKGNPKMQKQLRIKGWCLVYNLLVSSYQFLDEPNNASLQTKPR